MGITITVEVNGESHTNDVEPRILLTSYLREELNLTGTHVGCDTSNCGAAPVRLDVKGVRSCPVLGVRANGDTVVTIGGLASENGDLHPLPDAFWEKHGLQCGFCTPGMIMSAYELLGNNPNPTEEDIREGMSGNLCRCTGYHNIVKAIEYAAEKM